MNILFVGRLGMPKAQTGDATQLRSTMALLSQNGHSVVFFAVTHDGYFDNDGVRIAEHDFRVAIEQADVIHFFLIKSALFKRVRLLMMGKPIVLSPVYWFDWTRIALGILNSANISSAIKKSCVYLCVSRRLLMDYRGVDVFLPNSPAEGDNVFKCFRTSREAISIPVINAFDTPEFDVDALPRPSDIPDGEYVVYPGVFSERKNQLQFIKAVRDLPYSFVFMGGVIDLKFYNKCKAAANERMSFIGYSSSADRRYWSVLSHARCACLASDCETPGIALLEASYAGARPIVTSHGGNSVYYGCCAEYLEPLSQHSIRRAVQLAWDRGRLSREDRSSFLTFSWKRCVAQTEQAYELAMNKHGRNLNVDLS